MAQPRNNWWDRVVEVLGPERTPNQGPVGIPAPPPDPLSEDETYVFQNSATQIAHQQALVQQQQAMLQHHLMTNPMLLYGQSAGGPQQMKGMTPVPGGITQLQGFSSFAAAVTAAAAPWARNSLKSEGIRYGEIIAWRCWRVVDGLLRSVAADHTWSPQAVEEGDVLNGYGIHAYKAMLGPLRDGYIELDHHRTAWALGTVAMWGEIVEHEHGYRSQYARVHSIDDWGAVHATIKEVIRHAYLPRQVAEKAED